MTTVIIIGVGMPISYMIGLAIHELSLSRDAFLVLSRTDTLTGLLNRRAFLEAFDISSGTGSLVILDIDCFKSVNDLYGHESGDQTIIAVAQSLQSVFGPEHVVARIGGEEFAVLVQGHDREERLALADRARTMIEGHPVSIVDGRLIGVTISGGMAELADGRGFGPVFAAADTALYMAKAAGRNRILHSFDIADLDTVTAPRLPMSKPVQNEYSITLCRG